MPNKRIDFSDFVSGGPGNSDFGRAHRIDLNVTLPQSTDNLVGVDLTHIIHVDEVAAAKGAGGGGGGSGGGGTTTFAPYTAGAPGGYNITIEFKGTWTVELYNVFKAAADQLTALIIGDLPNVTVYGGKGGPKTIDDILITAELGNIDGVGSVLGQAGPTAVRTDSSLPATATMKFDIAEVTDMGIDVFTDVVLHEMAHSLGFGSIWGRLGLVTNGQFTGSNAVEEFHDLGGTGFIPVEQDGGSGTAGSHWDEEFFGNELLTGYIDAGENYFTSMSAASFMDLGYRITDAYVAWSENDGYTFA
jgi:hypothetical protein